MQTCDLCGSAESKQVAADSPQCCRTVVCSNCGLIYASPQETIAALDSLYEDSFDGDPGSRSRAATDLMHDIAGQDRRAAEWGLNLIHRFMEVSGKRILDLRCQTGALSESLRSEGAEVFGVDAFEANVDYCRRVRALTNVALLPFSRFAEAAALHRTEFDAVAALQIHMLAHLLSPRRALAGIFEVLKPGGYFFLIEKDVLLPTWLPNYVIQYVLDSGRAHQYHLTSHTIARYVQRAGFEIVECEVDKEYLTSLYHVRLIARKPVGGAPAAKNAGAPFNGPSARQVRSELRRLKRAWYLHRIEKAIKPGIRRFAGRLPGVKPSWEFLQRRLMR